MVTFAALVWLYLGSGPTIFLNMLLILVKMTYPFVLFLFSNIHQLYVPFYDSKHMRLLVFVQNISYHFVVLPIFCGHSGYFF